jgi:hypothetical protein
MKSVINVLADCEIYESILVMKSLIQKIRLVMLLSFQANVSRNIHSVSPLSGIMRVAACHTDRVRNELNIEFFQVLGSVPSLLRKS